MYKYNGLHITLYCQVRMPHTIYKDFSVPNISMLCQHQKYIIFYVTNSTCFTVQIACLTLITIEDSG